MLAPERHHDSGAKPQLQADNTTPQITGYPQWVAWRYGKIKPNGKRGKIPIDPSTGRFASTDKPETWGTYEEAVAAADLHGCNGIGFVFTAADPFVGIDTDDVTNADGEIEAWADELVGRFGSYTEVSPSGTGLHIIVLGKLAGKGIKSGQIEIYDRDRFFTWTGTQYGENAEIVDRQDQLDELYSSLQVAQKAPRKRQRATTDTYSPEDHEVLEKARSNGKTGQKFAALYDGGDVPHTGKSGGPDHSRTHWELIKMLAFWTGNDFEQIERLFTASAHGMHDKWGREDYRIRTISKAIERTPNPYQWTRTKPQAVPEVTAKLEQINATAEREVWSGRNGPRNRWILDGLVYTGGQKGEAHPAGVAVTVSVGYLAWVSGIGSYRGLVAALKELEADGWITVLKRGRKIDEPNTYLLRSERVRKPVKGSLHTPVKTSFTDMRGLLRRVREDGTNQPGREIKSERMDGNRKVSYVVSTLPQKAVVKGSIGNAGALIIEKVLLVGGSVGVDELAAMMGSKRTRDFKSRQLSKMLQAGLLVMQDDGTVTAPEDLRERLEQHLVDTGCTRAAERQMDRIRAASIAARSKPDRAPTDADLRADRSKFQQNLPKMHERDHERELERELEKVGPTPTTFLYGELSGLVGMYWPAIVERFEERGGHKRILSKYANRMGVRWFKQDDGIHDGWYVALREAAAA